MNYLSVTYLTTLTLAIHFKAGEASSVSQWLSLQNQARSQVGLRPLQWDSRLAGYAQRYANQRRYDCAMVHSHGHYGENLLWAEGMAMTPAQAVGHWVLESRDYHRYTNSCSGRDCGHYTQIVWRGSRRVGCARAVCYGGGGVIFVCEYDPPGNYYGQRPY